MTLVWVESLRQASEMLQWWRSDHPHGVRSTAKNIKALTLHVLSSAGFGKSYPFGDSIVAAAKSEHMNYREALTLILENAMLILIFGPSFLARLSRPKKLAQLGQATVVFQKYMTDILEEEKYLMSQGKSGGKNLMTSLIRASDDKTAVAPARNNTKDNALVGHHRDGLTDTEIYGNMFVFSFAGHDTTAHSLAFAVTLLVAHPEVQDWLTEELQHYLKDDPLSNWKYEVVFPRLKRCLAVLFETLRLYDPLIGVVKTTGSKPQKLTVAGKILNLPPDMHVNPNFLATQTQPRFWGPDSLHWRPSRWILSSPTPPHIKSIEGEHFYVPPKGSFVPWAEGPRSCPGRKFAQVEHVAVMAALFKDHRVQPVLKPGENMQQACLRIMDVVEDKGMVLLLQMLNPENANVEWQRR
ncbi:hypothetical protein MMC07_004659 [Pseudocyphellaria aurata]|nr:hypothetical protein [Pseudocyphellaria aurata]